MPVIYFFFPETRLLSLEDINARFGDEVAVHYFGATEAEEEEYKHAIEIEGEGGIGVEVGKVELSRSTQVGEGGVSWVVVGHWAFE